MKNKKKYVLLGLICILGGFLLYQVVNFAVYIYASVNVINTQAAQRSDYTKITTPLRPSVTSDLCLKFQISPVDRRCQIGAVVYGPDFFDDIEGYFQNLPQADATYKSVQGKLGAYLVSCDKPDNRGRYRCIYDLKGDGLYPIDFDFTQDGHYYVIHAIVGGS